MHIRRFASMGLLVLAMTAAVAAQGFKVYPGATKYTPPDTKETKEAMEAVPPGTTTDAYLTGDSFEKVVAFYKTFAKEYSMPRRRTAATTRLPNGQDLKQTFFIFDGADSIVTSRHWAKVQRPFVGSSEMKGMTPQYHDIRDVTEIVFTQK